MNCHRNWQMIFVNMKFNLIGEWFEFSGLDIVSIDNILKRYRLGI